MTNSIVEVFKQAAVHLQDDLLNLLKSKDFHDHESMILEACFIICALDALYYDSTFFSSVSSQIQSQRDFDFEVLSLSLSLSLSLDFEAPPPPPSASLTKWLTFIDSEGRIIDSKALRKRIFYGGVDPGLRKEVWPFLLGYHAYDSTSAEREYLMSVTKSEYEAIKNQWQYLHRTGKKIYKFRERKGLIDEDVVRTDRSLSFYDGDDNPNVNLLRDILLTYSFYNFDLGYCQVQKMANETGLDFSDQIILLENKYHQALKDLYTHLIPMQRAMSDFLCAAQMAKAADYLLPDDDKFFIFYFNFLYFFPIMKHQVFN
ncbi:hypothetical protein ACSBR1_039974 [Camellia fascicularis]